MAARANDIMDMAVRPSSEYASTPRAATPRSRQPAERAEVQDDGGRYGEGRPIGWKALLLIAALHGILLTALCLFDVVHIGRKPPPRLTVIDIKPLEVTPPPTPAPRPAEKQKPVERPIMSPPPIVQVAAPSPPIAAVPIAPPPPPAPSAPAAPSAVVSEVAPPISAPDGSAKSLGNPSPRYPFEARRQRQEGTVRLRVVITSEGRVKDIAVARTSGFDSLDESALQTVRRWRFLPGKQAGVAVEAVGFLNIPFRLT